MAKVENKNILKAAIITMSFVQMGTNGIAPILDQIGKAFPEASATKVQFLMTFPSIFMVIFSFLAAVMTNKLPKKKLAISGLVLVSVGGLGAFFIHPSLTVLFAWAAVLGIGIGMVMPVAPSLVTECFKGPERQSMLGIQNSSATVGSMIMTFLGGLLAAAGWHYGYLVYLIAVPGIIITILGMPEEHLSSRSESRESSSVKIKVWREMIIGFCFLMLFSYIPANLAMIVTEKNIGGSALAGSMSTVFLFGGMAAGFIFGLIFGKLRAYTQVLGILLLASGSLVLSISTNAVLFGAACFVAGASISLVMPVCMGGVSKMTGHETLGTGIILSFANIGVFIAPVLTSITSAVRGSDATMYRFQTVSVLSVVLALAVFLTVPKQRK